jgi:hypothetical protein
LFAFKGIQTLDLMEIPPRPKPLPLEPTPWEKAEKLNLVTLV